MLQNIRDNSQGLIAKFIIGLIIIPFALFGIDSLVSGNGQVNAASVNGEDITAAELDQAVRLERVRRIRMMGDNIEPSLIEESALRAPALEQLIQERLLLQSADQADVGVSVATLDQAIISMPQFQENGKFSPVLYQNVLRSNGYSTAYFKQLISKDMLISQLTAGVANSEFVTQKELQDVAKIVAQTRSFRYLRVPKDALSDSIKIPEERITEYYEANIDQFQTENSVKLSYIELKTDGFYDPVDPQELREVYAAEIADYKSQEERGAAHILVEISGERTEEEALALMNEIALKLKESVSFAELAKQYSDDLGSAQNGGDLGYTSGDTFPQPFEEALASLQVNEVSSAVKTDAGYHLIKATDIKSVDVPSFDEREPFIKQRIQAAAAEAKLVTVVENLRDLVFNSEGLTGPAKELDLTVSQSDLFGRSTAAGVFANPQVIAAAFSEDVLKDGNNSEVLELAPDHYIVISVDDHQPPRAMDLADVKSDIVAELTREESNARMLSLGNQLVADLSAGKTYEALAAERGYQWQIEESVTRTTATVNREVLATAFGLSSAAISQHNVDVLPSGDIVILQLEQIDDGRWQQIPAVEQNGVKTELTRNATSQSLSRFLSVLRENAEITIL